MAEQIRAQGETARRFGRVREVFEKSFEAGEVGAALAVTVDGELVVDLWGGHRDAARTKPWLRDTLVNVYSTTKGMTAICANRLAEQGKLDLDAPVAQYWPEFAQAGKEGIPVRWLLSHKAGLAALRETIPASARYDWKQMTEALAAEKPWWPPGTKHGYHALTFGYLVGEVVRRIDGRTLGAYFRDELAAPLGLDFWIGFGPELDERVAEMIPAPATPPGVASPFAAAARDPESLVGRTFGNPVIETGAVNTRAWRAAEIPAANGHGTARGLARIYGALARDGELEGVPVLSPAQIARANSEQSFGPDEVLSPLHTRFGLGFFMTQPMIPFGPNPRSFGHPGAGGSIAFADPDARVSVAYVMNQMQVGLAGDARGFRLIAEVYEALR
ncbi:MAG: beta-lactamase family protein [Deltaproteobacteria bacterium]|nr:beta-lactamase family protein [Deltaproteobacteria bacterium]